MWRRSEDRLCQTEEISESPKQIIRQVVNAFDVNRISCQGLPGNVNDQNIFPHPFQVTTILSLFD